MDEILLDELHLRGPTFVVGGEGLGPAGQRNSVESGLGDGEDDAVSGFLERKGDERRRLGGVVDVTLHGIRVPAEREQLLRFHLLDQDLNRQAIVFLLGLGYRWVYCGWHDHPANGCPWHEVAIELHAKPAAEFGGVGHCPPHALWRRTQMDLLF